MLDQNKENIININFKAIGKMLCKIVTIKPTNAKGTRQYPTELTHKSNDLSYIKFTLYFQVIYN